MTLRELGKLVGRSTSGYVVSRTNKVLDAPFSHDIWIWLFVIGMLMLTVILLVVNWPTGAWPSR